MKWIALMALMLLPSAGTAELSDDTLFQRGMKSFERALYVEALGDFAEVVYRNPSSPLADRSRTLIWEAGDRLRKMEKRWALSEEERREFIRLAKQDGAARSDRRREALAGLEPLIQEAGKDPAGFLAALGGPALLGEEKHPSAEELQGLKVLARLEAVKAGLGRRGERFRKSLHEARGFIALRKGKKSAALSEWSVALGILPDEGLRRMKDAVASGTPEAPGDKPFQDALALGKSLYRKGDFAGAHEKLRQALGLNPGDPEALRYAGLAADRLNDRRRKESIDRKLKQARDLQARTSPLEAMPLLVEILELDPLNAEARARLEEVKKSLSRRAPPLEKQAPPPPAPFKNDRPAAEEAYTMGMVHYVQDEPEKALPYFEKAARLDPTFEEAARALESVRRERTGR